MPTLEQVTQDFLRFKRINEGYNQKALEALYEAYKDNPYIVVRWLVFWTANDKKEQDE